MKRYQLYLNPQSVAIIDFVGKETGLLRSEIIRRSLDAIAHDIAHLAYQKKNFKGPLDSFVGAVTLKNGVTTNTALKPDHLYLQD